MCQGVTQLTKLIWTRVILANSTNHEVRGQLIEDLRQILLCFYPGRDWGQLRGEERSQRRRALGLMSALTFLFLALAVAALGFALYAQRERLLAESRQLAAQSAHLQSQSPSLLPRSILLAVESLQINPNLEADQVIRSGVPLLDKAAITIPYHEKRSLMTLSPTGEYLATAGYLEKQVDLWKIGDRKQVASLPHDDPIQDIAFTPNGRFLVVAGLSSSVVVVWDLASRKAVGRLDCRTEVNVLAFSHDGKYLATGQKDHTVRLWRTRFGEKVEATQAATLQHQDEVFGVTFSQDDQYLAASFLNIATVWKLSGQESEIKAKSLGYVEAPAAVNSIAISPDDKYMATGICCGEPFQLWDLTSQALVATMPDEGPASVVFSPDSKYVAAISKDDTAGIWDVATRREVSRIESQSNRVAFSSDGKYFVTHSGDAIVFWEWNDDPITAVFNPGSFAQFASSRDGQVLVLTQPTEAVESFDVYTQRPVLQMNLDAGESTLALSRDGTNLATTRNDGTVFVRHLTSRPEVIATMKRSDEGQGEAKGDVRSALFSPDAHCVVVRKRDGTLLFWDLANKGMTRSTLQDPKVYFMRFSEDGKHLISASGLIRGRASQEEHTVRVWDVATGRPTATIQIAWPPEVKRFEVAIAISPDGRHFATSKDAVAQVWDSSTGKELTHMTHDKTIHDLAFSPDGKFLATASVDGTARLWDAKSGKEVTRMRHEDAVWKIVFNPDGKHLGTASDDRTARIWEYPTGREIARAVHKEMARDIIFSVDGKRAISWSPTAGEIKSWLWRSEDLTDAACNRLTRNMTSAEWHEYRSGSPRKTCPNLP